MIPLSRTNLAWLIAYLAFMEAVVSSVHEAREFADRALKNVEAQQDWEVWEKEARRQAKGEGPVKRRAPKSDRPPMLALLDDHFGVCLSAAVGFGSLLYVMLMFAIRASLATSSPQRGSPQRGDEPLG